MCGICGVVSDYLTQRDHRIFLELMHLNVLRGWEGAGVVMMPKSWKDKPEIIRTTETGTSLVLSSAFDDALKTGQKSVLLGHTRAPTKGENVIEHVHPHESGQNIIGVHNGTFRKIDGKWFTGSEASDTKAVYDIIARDGLKEAIKNVDGAYTLVWIDTEKRTLNFLRNNERPLYYIQGWQSFFFSSEQGHLFSILNRHNAWPKDGKCEPIPVNQWLALPIPARSPFKLQEGGEVKPEYQHCTDSDPFLEGWAERGDTLVSGGNVGRRNRNGWQGYGNFNHANAANHNGNVQTLRHSASAASSSLARHCPPARAPAPILSAEAERGDHTYQTYPGFFCEREKLLQYLSRGCAYCSVKADMTDWVKNETHWCNYNEYLCDACWNNPVALDDASSLFPELKNRKVS